MGRTGMSWNILLTIEALLQHKDVQNNPVITDEKKTKALNWAIERSITQVIEIILKAGVQPTEKMRKNALPRALSVLDHWILSQQTSEPTGIRAATRTRKKM
jgi:hypothetical protein